MPLNWMAWLQARWATIAQLPESLDQVASWARSISRDDTMPRSARDSAARIMVEALADRGEALAILSKNIKATSPGSLGAVPILVIVGATAAAVGAALAAIMARQSTYNRELRMIEAGTVSTQDITSLRDGSRSGVAGALAGVTGAARYLALVGAVYVAWKAYDGR